MQTQTAAIMKQETVDAAAAVAAKTTYFGAGGAVVFGLTANEFAAFAGVLIALIGLIANIFFKWKSHKLLEQRLARETEEFKAIFSRSAEMDQ